MRFWRHRRARPIIMRTLRLTLAAVVAYVVALLLFPTTQPLTGPLTALLVVQATLFSTVTTGLRRVLSVVAGVLVAVLVATFVGLTWWSLGAVIGSSILIGQLLRLGEHLLEVPISAMLVLGVGNSEIAASARVVETLVGAGVGVLVNLVLPPNLRTGSAGAAVERVATEAAALLDRVAAELPEAATSDQARRWLEDFRALSRYVDRADRAVEEATDSRRLNPRAVGTLDSGPILRSGLDALEHSTVGLRALFRSIADGVSEVDGEEQGYDEDLRGAFAVLLSDLASSVRAFGALVRAESSTAERRVGGGGVGGVEGGVEEALSQALETLRETRVRLTELLLVDAGSDPTLWQLRGSLLAAVERVLRELDVEERARRRRQWQQDAMARRRPSQAVVRLRDTSRQVANQPRRRLRRQ